MLSGFFGVLALLLAGLGLYGLMSYAVGQRRHEIGIRMALGAAAQDVVRLMLARALILVAVGIASGVVLTVWASRYVEALLFGVPSNDPATLAVAGLVLITVGIAAGWIPARRASSIDPVRVLHAD